MQPMTDTVIQTPRVTHSRILAVAIPAILANFSAVLPNLVDTALIGQTGDANILVLRQSGIGQFAVVTADEVRARVPAGACEAACLREIGAATGARYLVRTEVAVEGWVRVVGAIGVIGPGSSPLAGATAGSSTAAGAAAQNASCSSPDGASGADGAAGAIASRACSHRWCSRHTVP